MKLNLSLFALSIALVFTGCSSDDEENAPTLSNDESAELVAEALGTEITELTSTGPGLAALADGGRSAGVMDALACGISYDTAFVRQYDGTYQSFDFSVSYGYELVCSGLIPSQLNFDYTITGAREGLRSSSNLSSDGDFAMTGLVGGSEYLVNGTAVASANGTLTGATDTYSLTGVSTLTVTDLAIGKVAQTVNSGTAAYSYTGSTSEGRTVEFSASVTFHGEQMATVLINGQSFEINWTTGEIEG